MTVIAVVLESG